MTEYRSKSVDVPVSAAPVVVAVTNAQTGLVVEQRFYLNGRLHRDEFEGPAVVMRDPESGAIERQEYRLNGYLHRENGPAVIGFTANDKPLQEYWYRGLRHRSDGPADISGDLSAGDYLVTYRRYGVFHRDPKEGPAQIGVENGKRDLELYAVNGEEFRNPEDGPYRIDYDDVNGSPTEFSGVGETRPAPRALIARRRIAAQLRPAAMVLALFAVQLLAA